MVCTATWDPSSWVQIYSCLPTQQKNLGLPQLFGHRIQGRAQQLFGEPMLFSFVLLGSSSIRPISLAIFTLQAFLPPCIFLLPSLPMYQMDCRETSRKSNEFSIYYCRIILLTGSSLANLITIFSRYSGKLLNCWFVGWKKWGLLRARSLNALQP